MTEGNLRVKLWKNVTLYKFLREISRILTIEGKRRVRYDNSTNQKGAFFMTILKKTDILRTNTLIIENIERN